MTNAEITRANRDRFHETAWGQRVCQGCDQPGQYESHHVTERAELKRRNRMDLVWDTRNVMRLCEECHRLHTVRMKPISLARLLDCHFEFAFYVMGYAAYRYLGEKYAGEDPRLDQYLQKWEEENE